MQKYTKSYNNIYNGWPWEKYDEIFKKVSFCETLKFEKVTGNNNKADAKIAGITPAELILSGKCEESPPYILFPICLLG